MRRDDVVRLRHMLDAARETMAFCAGRTRADLGSNRMLLLSVVKDIEIIGESASQVAEEARAELSNVPWLDIIGMRNRLVHAYFRINVDIVWETVQSDLSALVRELESALDSVD